MTIREQPTSPTSSPPITATSKCPPTEPDIGQVVDDLKFGKPTHGKLTADQWRSLIEFDVSKAVEIANLSNILE